MIVFPARLFFISLQVNATELEGGIEHRHRVAHPNDDDRDECTKLAAVPTEPDNIRSAPDVGARPLRKG
jgi:hypothetical protein